MSKQEKLAQAAKALLAMRAAAAKRQGAQQGSRAHAVRVA